MKSFHVLCFLLFWLVAVESARIDKLEKEAKDKKQRKDVEKMLDEIGHGKEKAKDGHGNGLRKVKEKKEKKNGNKVTRINQEYDDLPVEGFQIVERESSGKPVDEMDKATGKPTGKKLKPPKSKDRNGKYVLDLEKDLGKIDKDKLKPTQALKTVKEKWGKGKSISNEHAESIVWVDEKTGEAKLAYKASFEGDGEGGPVMPVLITDTQGNTLQEFDNIQHQSIVSKGTGRGGNSKIGCYDYGSAKPLLKIKDLQNGKCQYDIGSVKVVHLHGSSSHTDNTPFEYNCYHQASDAINGGCSPVNDALYFGSKTHDMYQKWYKTPPLTFPMVLKVHYKTGYENAFWNGAYATFGDGGSSYYPQPTLDIISHEIGHGVTHQSSGLVYADQSGGLNEAFSDMAGKAAERYVRGYKSETFNWGFDYDSTKGPGALRYMNDPPKNGNQIDHMSKYYKGMSVHRSSGIYDKVFYRLATKLPYNLWDAFDLFYVANTKFWGANTNFVDAAELTLKATEEIKDGKHLSFNYNHINIQDIVGAFTEVGINCSKSGTVWNCTS